MRRTAKTRPCTSGATLLCQMASLEALTIGKQKKKPKAAKLSDDDIEGLAQVQIGHRVAGISRLDLAKAQGKGKKVAKLVADKKGRPDALAKRLKKVGKQSSKKKGK